jgi:hypothetical protein
MLPAPFSARFTPRRSPLHLPQDAFACAETILFSLDESALHRIEQSDAQRHAAAPPAGIAAPGSPGERPHTPGGGDTGGGDADGGAADLRPRRVPDAVTSASSRPATAAWGGGAGLGIPAGGSGGVTGFTPTLPPIKQDYEVRQPAQPPTPCLPPLSPPVIP